VLSHARVAPELSCKIISIGNITTGGTGKTPAVQWLAHLLQAQDKRVAVVARGYGGRLSQAGAIVSNGQQVLLNAADAGDEPVLHAKALPGVPVVIGRDRAAAVQMAVQQFGTEIVILDDGFQYWSLPRDLDVVLLDARRPFANGRLLPSGHLREPPLALRRADTLLLTRSDLATERQRATARANIEKITPAPLFEATHAPVALRDESNGSTVALKSLHSAPICAVSALADNEAFCTSLQACGAQVLMQVGRRDHHRWREAEVQYIAARARARGAEAIVTTEKDAVKMKADWVQPLPLWSLVIELRIADEAALQAFILNRLQV